MHRANGQKSLFQKQKLNLGGVCRRPPRKR